MKKLKQIESLKSEADISGDQMHRLIEAITSVIEALGALNLKIEPGEEEGLKEVCSRRLP